MSKTVKKIIKCFCDCTDLTEEEIKNIVLETIDAFVKNELSKKCFRSFVNIEHATGTPFSIQLLDCYELSNKLLHNPSIRDDNYDDLYELIPTYELEKDLRLQVDQKSCPLTINKCLLEIQKECKLAIEQEIDYKNYKEKMLQKVLL